MTAIANEIGSQSVVVVLDVKKSLFGKYEVYTQNGKQASGRSPVELARQAEQLGAGEVLINSIDLDGQMKGYDIDLAQKVRAALTIPMTVLGGAGSLDDIARLIGACGVIGASAGSLFVFKGAYRAVLINDPAVPERDRLIRAALGPRQAPAP